MVIAGRDTTACTLSWLMFILTQNPEIQQRCCAEIDDKIGDGTPDPNLVTAANMPYLNGVVYETLRLYPPGNGMGDSQSST